MAWVFDVPKSDGQFTAEDRKWLAALDEPFHRDRQEREHLACELRIARQVNGDLMRAYGHLERECAGVWRCVRKWQRYFGFALAGGVTGVWAIFLERSWWHLLLKLWSLFQ